MNLSLPARCALLAAAVSRCWASPAPGGADTSAHAGARPDTMEAMSTPSLVGSLDPYAPPGAVITREELHWLDYRYLGGILETFPGVLLLDQESEGQYTQATFGGVDGRGVSYSANGRPLNNPASGLYNLYHFTTEYADRIEVITGPRAFLYGPASTGAAVNLVTKNYNSNKPFTKFNYSEGPYGYSIVDGTFSQNISRRMNVTVGFQHQTTDGRFTSEADDAWSSREKIRFNLTPRLNLIVSHAFTSTRTGLTGGVDITRSGGAFAFDNVRAVMKQDSTYEKVTAHDVDISLLGTFLGDTLGVSDLTFYYSHSRREFREREDPYHDFPAQVSSDHVSSWAGVCARQDFASAFQRFSAGVNVELRRIDGSPDLGVRRNVTGALWAKEELDGRGPWTLAIYGRLDRYLRKDYGGIGADAAARPARGVRLFAGASLSWRVPNYQELYWNDSTLLRPRPVVAERHAVAEAGAEFASPERGSLRIAFTHRRVTDPILFTPYQGTASPFPGAGVANGPAIMSDLLSLQFGLRFGWLSIEGNARYLLQHSGGATLETYPKFSGLGGIYYRGSVLDGRLALKAGFRGRFTGPYEGMVFNPEMLVYVPNTGPTLGTSGSGDFLLIAHIGDAYVHFIWENIAGIRYYGTPYYPAGERGIRFGISWEFLN